MDISIHTEVRCADGLVGKSTHIIVDLVTEQVTPLNSSLVLFENQVCLGLCYFDEFF